MDSSPRTVRSLPSAYKNARSLPDDVWCKRCSQFRPLSMFAQTRQNYATYHLTHSGARMGSEMITKKLLCNSCTGAPSVELRCTGCNKKRPRDLFSTTQRSDPDNARCRLCVIQIENVRPGQQQPDEEDGSDNEYIADMSRLDLSSHASTDGGVPLTSTNGFVPVPSTSRSTRVPTNTTTSATSSSGRSTSTTTSTIKAPPVKVGTGGFAVVPAVVRPVPEPDYPSDDNEVIGDSDSDPEYNM